MFGKPGGGYILYGWQYLCGAWPRWSRAAVLYGTGCTGRCGLYMGAEWRCDTAMQNCSSGQASCNTGAANTTFLAGLGATYQAATYCENLTPPSPLALGHSDWYLPAQMEMITAAMMLGTSAPYGFSAAVYVSSSEYDGTQAVGFNFGTGLMAFAPKTTSYRLRCARK